MYSLFIQKKQTFILYDIISDSSYSYHYPKWTDKYNNIMLAICLDNSKLDIQIDLWWTKSKHLSWQSCSPVGIRTYRHSLRTVLRREIHTLSLYSALMMLQFKMDAHVAGGMVMILVTVWPAEGGMASPSSFRMTLVSSSALQSNCTSYTNSTWA